MAPRLTVQYGSQELIVSLQLLHPRHQNRCISCLVLRLLLLASHQQCGVACLLLRLLLLSHHSVQHSLGRLVPVGRKAVEAKAHLMGIAVRPVLPSG